MTCWLCGFDTTELATNSETPSCENGPCQVCEAVATLDDEINQVEATLRRLLAKRSHLRSEQNRFHDRMHRLPVELKKYTFELVLPKFDQWGVIAPVARSTNIVMPPFLTSICKYWRDIAWSIPSLWSTVRIILKSPSDTSDPSTSINFAHDWILRSRPLPLTLCIDVDDGLEDEWRRLLDVIGPCSNRWHSLSIAIPFDLLLLSHHSNLQYDRLRRFQIMTSDAVHNQPVPLLDPTISPEEIAIAGLSFQTLHFSWNNLTSVTVAHFYLEEITQLFQHASRMTDCNIAYPDHEAGIFPMPPIIHQCLKTLSFFCVVEEVAAMLLRSLTLPSLREFRAEMISVLTPAYLPALVHRSSCPLTIIRLSAESGSEHLDNVSPLPGVTDIVLEIVNDLDLARELLLDEKYFPNLRHLTLRLPVFLSLWEGGIIPFLQLRKRPPADTPNEGGGGRLCKLVVVDKMRLPEFDDMWDSDVGMQLKGMNIILREDGFEFLL